MKEQVEEEEKEEKEEVEGKRRFTGHCFFSAKISSINFPWIGYGGDLRLSFSRSKMVTYFYVKVSHEMERESLKRDGKREGRGEREGGKIPQQLLRSDKSSLTQST